MSEPGSARPVLRIVKGDATDAEIAALVAVLSARAAATAAAETPAPRRSEWAGHERRMRRPVHPSAGGWRASAFPR
ncbi:MAG TPA: acyl-CoA carboxylase subunit epsilon [Nocardioidaceae bacterium]|nr:acyl-CoA carboxylase subunit epsilon [Nocardioidaceae bacterium]